MSSRNLKVTCIWKSDEFVVSESHGKPSEDEAYIIIDEPSEKMSVHIPSTYSIVQKRIIERRVQTIAKSGFLLPNFSIRIGRGFNVTITKDESIPETLLQVGHHYSYDKPIEQTSDSSSSDVPTVKISTESDYKPGFLIHEPAPSTITPQSEIVPTRTLEEDEIKPDIDSIAGRFIIALSKTGDVYLSRSKNHFIVEYSMGQVEFSVENDEIIIHSTKRIPSTDSTLELAIEAAKR